VEIPRRCYPGFLRSVLGQRDCLAKQRSVSLFGFKRAMECANRGSSLSLRGLFQKTRVQGIYFVQLARERGLQVLQSRTHGNRVSLTSRLASQLVSGMSESCARSRCKLSKLWVWNENGRINTWGGDAFLPVL
jgi:hypothetical protein